MHLSRILLKPELFPVHDCYPFHLGLLNQTHSIEFKSPITFFEGENGTGKSTILKAIAKRCRINIWRDETRSTYRYNKHAEELYRYIDAQWTSGPVPGSYFSADIFQYFAEFLDDWAKTDPAVFEEFGGSSLLTKSHGQSLMAYFSSRYRIKGLYLLDEPETALSPRRQIELLDILRKMASDGHAQFIIASHSPILLSCEGADIYSFNHSPVQEVSYHETEYYRFYKDFLNNH